MEALRVGRNELCPCGSGRKFKVCCLRRQAVDQVFRPPPMERPRPVFGDGATMPPHPHPQSQRWNGNDRPTKRIPIHYTYPEPFGSAECVYCFPVDLLIVLAHGGVLRAEWLQPGMQFSMDDGILGTVTAVEPPKVWEPPSRVPDKQGRYLRRVLGTIKHKGFVVIDITFGGQTVTGTPDHLWYSVSRKAWLPAQTLRRGELLLNGEGCVVAVESISEPRYGMIELYNLEVEEFHTYFVGSSQHGSALVHNGTGDYIKKPITAHGAERLADPTRMLTAAEEAAVRASHTLRANNGATVYLHQFEPGRFNVIIEGAGGFMTRYRHLSMQDIMRMAVKFEWRAP